MLVSCTGKVEQIGLDHARDARLKYHNYTDRFNGDQASVLLQ